MLNTKNPEVRRALEVMAETARLLERDTHPRNNPCNATAKATPRKLEPTDWPTAITAAMATGLSRSQAVAQIDRLFLGLRKQYVQQANVGRR